MIRKGTIEELLKILERIPEFEEPYDKSEFEKRLGNVKSLILIAESGSQLQGFKCGYQRDETQNTFYSWMGGVITEFRQLGIAKDLLFEMESWCREEKYSYLTFKTLNRHKSMLIFSIKHGFDILSVEESPKDPAKRIWLIKKLD